MEARRNEIKDRERGEGGYEEGKWRQGEMRLKTERKEGGMKKASGGKEK